MTFIEVASDLENIYKTKYSDGSRIQFLARIAGAVDDKTGTVTLNSVSKLQRLAALAQNELGLATDITTQTRSSMLTFISLLNLVHDVFLFILESDNSVEEIFTKDVQPESFEAVSTMLSEIKEDSQLDISKIARMLPTAEFGNIFTMAKYEGDNLTVYRKSDMLVGSFETCIENNFYFMESTVELVKLLDWFKRICTNEPVLKQLIEPRMNAVQNLINKKQKLTNCALIFRDGQTYDFKRFPFKLRALKSLEGIDMRAFTDKLTGKRVVVYVL